MFYKIVIIKHGRRETPDIKHIHGKSVIAIFIYLFYFILTVLGFELRASCLLGRQAWHLRH
jgi:hypothetical protein